MKLIKRVRNWVWANKTEFVILTLILILGAFLRLYRISDYMTFLGDEGRDAIIVRRFLKYFDLMLIGPGTSIGGMYLGPLYYYLIAPSLWLAGYSPVGPSVFVAILGVATIWFVWYVGRIWLGKEAGLVGSAFYAVSPTVIIYSRSSWNPNVMPFFALLCLYALWQVYKNRRFYWLIWLGFSYAFVLQSHYLGLLLAPVFLIFLLISLQEVKDESLKRKSLVKNSIIGLLIFLFLMSPLIVFDVRHGWVNFNAIKKFFVVRQETVSIKPWKAIPKVWPIFYRATTNLAVVNNKALGIAVSLALFVYLLWLGFRKKNLLLVIWMTFGLLGLGLYKQEIYDHYYGFLFPAFFLLLGGLAKEMLKRQFKFLFLFIFIFLIIFNLVKSPITKAPNMQLKRAQEVAAKIGLESGGERFNLAVIAERNYQDGYKYFLEMWGKPVVEIDAQKSKETITDQLFVVCEIPPEKCDPTHNSRAEIANFGWSTVADQYEVFGTRVYKLIHQTK